MIPASRFQHTAPSKAKPITQGTVLQLLTPAKKRSRPRLTFRQIADGLQLSYSVWTADPELTHMDSERQHAVLDARLEGRLAATLTALVKKGLLETNYEEVDNKVWERVWVKPVAKSIKKDKVLV